METLKKVEAGLIEKKEELSQASPDIKILNKNTTGRDIFVGDIHGCADQLKKIIDGLGANDRLIIVGDLIDRGIVPKEGESKDFVPGSPKVMELILEAVKNGKKIEVCLGNHEKDFLDAFEMCQRNQLTEEMAEHIRGNGGNWYIDTFISINNKSKDIDENAKFNTFKRYAEFIRTLPYIIHAPDFNTVHADLPFSNRELLRRIEARHLALSADEKRYAIFARRFETDPTLQIRDKKSENENFMVTYCGHTIEDTILKGLRKMSLHFDLDIGGFFFGQLLMVVHMPDGRKKVELVGDMGSGTRLMDEKEMGDKQAILNKFREDLEKVLNEYPSPDKIILYHRQVCQQFRDSIIQKIQKELKNTSEYKTYTFDPNDSKKIQDIEFIAGKKKYGQLTRDLTKFKELGELITTLNKDDSVNSLNQFYILLEKHTEDLKKGGSWLYSENSMNYLEKLSPQMDVLVPLLAESKDEKRTPAPG